MAKNKTKKSKGKKVSLTKALVAIGLLLILSIGVTYAYFTANITGSESSTTITVGSATMAITYSGGSAINVSNVVPGWTSNKSITVTGTNTNSQILDYTLTLKKTTNTFSTGALKYTLTNTTTGGVVTPITTKSDVSITTGTADMTIGSGSFAVGASAVQHTYTFTISFPDTGVAQNTEQGKTFTGYIATTSTAKAPAA